MASLSTIEKKVENLPDEIIKRLDDRYLKKDDAENQYITRREGRVFSFVFGTIVTGLTLWATIAGYFKGNS